MRLYPAQVAALQRLREQGSQPYWGSAEEGAGGHWRRTVDSLVRLGAATVQSQPRLGRDHVRVVLIHSDGLVALRQHEHPPVRLPERMPEHVRDTVIRQLGLPGSEKDKTALETLYGALRLELARRVR